MTTSPTPLFDRIVSGHGSDIQTVGSFAMKDIAPHIVCADGMKLSVQASRHHYCTPKTNDGPYTEVEVGYPTDEPPASWDEYGEAGCGVYAYVPVDMVRRFILDHGGEA